MFYFPTISIFLLFSLLTILSSQLMAQGGLIVFPNRVVFEGQIRIIEMNVANSSVDSAKYNISFLEYRAKDIGGYEKITTPDPGQKFASNNIRFLPRTLTLGPHESQVVLLQLTRSEQLEPGEYRSHIYFKALRNQTKLGEDISIKDTTTMTVKIVPSISMTIPVLIRVGKSTTAVNISDLKLETTGDGSKNLLFCLNRSGNMSTYGDVIISHISPNGKETKIGTEKGIAVYTPNLLRRVKINLENLLSVNMSTGILRVLYFTDSKKRIEKLAEAELSL